MKHFKDTIKAKQGYYVKKCTKNGEPTPYIAILDGEDLIFIAEQMDKTIFYAERDDNETFNLMEIFTTVKGNRFVYWRDEELDEDYITKL